MAGKIALATQQVLVILPGITADRAARRHLLDYFRSRSPYRVFLPDLCQYFGIGFAARQLLHYLDSRELGSYQRCHFICYISGGFILRQALAQRPLLNLGRVVCVRSPLQERVPERSLRRYGPLPALKFGKVLFDLAGDRLNRLPELNADVGYVIEHGLSAQAEQLGLRAADFECCRNDRRFTVVPGRPTLETPLSHDRVYSDDGLLAQMLAFIVSGSFPPA